MWARVCVSAHSEEDDAPEAGAVEPVVRLGEIVRLHHNLRAQVEGAGSADKPPGGGRTPLHFLMHGKRTEGHCTREKTHNTRLEEGEQAEEVVAPHEHPFEEFSGRALAARSLRGAEGARVREEGEDEGGACSGEGFSRFVSHFAFPKCDKRHTACHAT